MFVLLAIVAVIFGVGWNPPHSKTHTFSSASDYSSAKETGCTNSGAGCHDSEESYLDFNAYHPDTKCDTCHYVHGRCLHTLPLPQQEPRVCAVP